MEQDVNLATTSEIDEERLPAVLEPVSDQNTENEIVSASSSCFNSLGGENSATDGLLKKDSEHTHGRTTLNAEQAGKAIITPESHRGLTCNTITVIPAEDILNQDNLSCMEKLHQQNKLLSALSAHNAVSGDNIDEMWLCTTNIDSPKASSLASREVIKRTNWEGVEKIFISVPTQTTDSFSDYEVENTVLQVPNKRSKYFL